MPVILISNVMSPCPYLIEQDRSLSAAHAILRRHVGIFTAIDALRAFADLLGD